MMAFNERPVGLSSILNSTCRVRTDRGVCVYKQHLFFDVEKGRWSRRVLVDRAGADCTRQVPPLFGAVGLVRPLMVSLLYFPSCNRQNECEKKTQGRN